MRLLKFVMLSTFYPPYHLGGDALHVYYLSNELAKLGHEVHVIHSIDAYYLNRRQPPLGNYPNHERVILHPLESRLGVIAPLISGFVGLSHPLSSQALKLVEEIKPDVVHHHNIAGFGPAVLGAEAPKVFYTAHDYWLICPRNNLLKPDKTFCQHRQNCFLCCLKWKRPPQLWRYTSILEKMLSYIDMIITPSDYMRRTLEKAGISQPIITMPNFVPEPEEAGQPMYDLPYFLFVGLLEQHKGVLNLVEAFAQVKDKIDAQLLIVGSGSLEPRIKEFVTQNGCHEMIKLLGRIDDKEALTNLYTNAVALVIPSIWPENAPLVALEALACGTPVITSDRGGLPEIADKAEPNLIFRDKDELGQILVAMSGKAKDKTCSPKHIYSQFYSPDVFLTNYLGLIN